MGCLLFRFGVCKILSVSRIISFPLQTSYLVLVILKIFLPVFLGEGGGGIFEPRDGGLCHCVQCLDVG